MKILLPFDGSPMALRAVHAAIELAADGLNVSVVLANVQQPASLYEIVVAHDPAVIDQVSMAAGNNILLPAQALLETAGIAYETEVASGEPANTLIEILENYGCNLVVMGASGNSALRSAVLGSVSHEVLHASTVPVMIVKATDDTNPDVEE